MAFLDECIEFSKPAWERYIHHPWVEALFAGELDQERFQYWLIQDLSYVFDPIATQALGKCPPNNKWASNVLEYSANEKSSRVEAQLLDQCGNFAKTRWAARPRREAFNNFMFRVVHEGNFGEICCAHYPCFRFCDTFAERFKQEQPTNLPPDQVEWIMQFDSDGAKDTRTGTVQGINEGGQYASDYERERMLWTFLRATQHQVQTFDAAWSLSDPWGAGDIDDILAGAPEGSTLAA